SVRAIAGAVARLLASGAGAAFDCCPDLTFAIIIDQAAQHGGRIEFVADKVSIECAASDNLEKVESCFVEDVIALTRLCRSDGRAFFFERVLGPGSFTWRSDEDLDQPGGELGA